MQIRKALFSFFVFLHSLPCLALYNGSSSLPEMPEKGFFLKDSPFSFKAGYEGDFLVGRNVMIESGSGSNPSIQSSFNSASLTVGFVDRVEVYSLLGASKTSFQITTPEQESQTIHTGNLFAMEGGIRAILAFWREMKFGLDAKYFYAWPLQREWQIGACLSQRFAFLIPYGGVKYAQFHQDFHSHSLGSFSIQNKNPFGFFIGLGIAGEKGPLFDFEARFVDEYAFTGSLGIRF